MEIRSFTVIEELALQERVAQRRKWSCSVELETSYWDEMSELRSISSGTPVRSTSGGALNALKSCSGCEQSVKGCCVRSLVDGKIALGVPAFEGLPLALHPKVVHRLTIQFGLSSFHCVTGADTAK